jgi:zinc protease
LRVFVTGAIFCCLLASGSRPAIAQNAEPERENLLNGLRILYLPQPGNPNVLLTLRINSGAAFDLAEKGGMMALLGDALFPDAATREYVTGELGGRLEVKTTHDVIDVSISGKASELERLLDLLRAAVVTTQLGPDNVASLRAARLALLSQRSLKAADIADAAIAQRLFGAFPYAHSPEGTTASVTRIDRGDLMLVRERFLKSDNATLAVVGGVQKSRLMRAARQLLGPWEKSERTIPATFRQSVPPEAYVLALDSPGATNTEIRLAVRGLSRGDSDTVAANALAIIARDRWQAALPGMSSVAVHHEAHLLPGMFLLSASVPTASASKAVSAATDMMRSLNQTGPSAAELERARALLQTELSQNASDSQSLAQAWLDVETFKSPKPDVLATLIRNLTVSDVQRVASRLFKDAPVATVVVGNYEELKTAFAGKLEPATTAPDKKVSVPGLPIRRP